MRRARLPALVAALFVVAACGGGNGSEPAGSEAALPVAVFTNESGDKIELGVEVVATPEKRTRGLMFREHLPDDQGMLFDFGGETATGFWMKDTLIPLSLAFISERGVILGIVDMEPLTEEVHRPEGPYYFAIEVNQGWYERNGIAVGSTAELPKSPTGEAP
jgi:uncharacterized membrane protein (UPF0127 family)